MKKTLFFVIISTTLALGYGQPLKSEVLVKVGYIDIQKILSNYILAQNYQNEFDSIKKENYQQIASLKETLDNAIFQLKLDEPSLNREELRERWEAILKIKRKYEIKKEQIDAQLDIKESSLNEDILKNIYRAIKDIAMKYGFNLILEKKEVYFSTPDVDLSNYIIEKLNSDYISLHLEEEIKEDNNE